MHKRVHYVQPVENTHEIGVNGFNFNDIRPFTNREGWVDAFRVKPYAYDIVYLLTGKFEEKNGWWTGLKWDGLRLKENETIIRWKRLREITNDASR